MVDDNFCVVVDGDWCFGFFGGELVFFFGDCWFCLISFCFEGDEDNFFEDEDFLEDFFFGFFDIVFLEEFVGWFFFLGKNEKKMKYVWRGYWINSVGSLYWFVVNEMFKWEEMFEDKFDIVFVVNGKSWVGWNLCFVNN